jgi:hypothetical protein
LAIFSSEGSKAPGLDGFNFNFYKKFWELMNHKLFTMVLEFFRRGHLPKGINTSYIALIPKVAGSSSFNDYRPISLLNEIYKIIVKILTTRLKEVMQSVVSPSQSAFIASKNILDSVLIANEMLDSMKSRRCQGFLLKLDFRKAFDTVSWSYLNDVIGYMKFSARWRKWIMACVSTARLSVLINGSPTSEFTTSCGLRQGDPLSPFLFCLVAEGISVFIRKSLKMGALYDMDSAGIKDIHHL